VRERDESRRTLVKRLEDQAAAKGLSSDKDFRKLIAGSSESDLWEKFAEDCVECGACNFVCCTCHCFLLADGMSNDGVPTRARLWDSCLYMNFARVAGGANPRKHRAERLYNRFDKKFNFFPQILDTYACDGCGRCAEACTGKIDIRDVLKEVSG
jgi:predicted aldo/keto reductase-like oxidoreductase